MSNTFRHGDELAIIICDECGQSRACDMLLLLTRTVTTVTTTPVERAAAMQLLEGDYHYVETWRQVMARIQALGKP